MKSKILEPFENIDYSAMKELYDESIFYEVDYRAYRAEIPFYNFVCEHFLRDGAYCELGAGTGRLLLNINTKNAPLHAVEPAASMRERLLLDADALGIEHSRITLEGTKAHDFVGAENEMDVIAFPFNGILHVHTHKELREVFRHVRSKLEGGVFAIDMTMPSYEAMALGVVDWGRVDDRVHPDNGKRIVTCDRTEYDAKTHVLKTLYRFIFEPNPERTGVELFIEQRMWTYPEILKALDDEGFKIEHSFGDVDLKPFEVKSPRLMLVASKA